ncbi:hypothetical protein STEG23_004906, partial [Scotinomys teguina]
LYLCACCFLDGRLVSSSKVSQAVEHVAAGGNGSSGASPPGGESLMAESPGFTMLHVQLLLPSFSGI